MVTEEIRNNHELANSFVVPTMATSANRGRGGAPDCAFQLALYRPPASTARRRSAAHRLLNRRPGEYLSVAVAAPRAGFLERRSFGLDRIEILDNTTYLQRRQPKDDNTFYVKLFLGSIPNMIRARSTIKSSATNGIKTSMHYRRRVYFNICDKPP
ncbi:hypothetical protein EVAR_87932_1 [Eumeta japonica]|uniref:Uncharacterized protein n=1 Tax=Eumeta variegata TaxID=151549 RepID=A0A4C1WXM4_EUMVA|nr:hypothetical protein EVAR_87932_1 [Eumeta japonica]